MELSLVNWAVVAYVLEYVALEPEGLEPLVVTVDLEVTVYVTVSAQAALPPPKHPTIIRHRDRKKRCEIVFFIIVFGYLLIKCLVACGGGGEAVLWGRAKAERTAVKRRLAKAKH